MSWIWYSSNSSSLISSVSADFDDVIKAWPLCDWTVVPNDDVMRPVAMRGWLAILDDVIVLVPRGPFARGLCTDGSHLGVLLPPECGVAFIWFFTYTKNFFYIWNRSIHLWHIEHLLLLEACWNCHINSKIVDYCVSYNFKNKATLWSKWLYF